VTMSTGNEPNGMALNGRTPHPGGLPPPTRAHVNPENMIFRTPCPLLRELESSVNPVLLGYQCVRLDTPKDHVAKGHRSLATFATREGFALGTCFVDANVNDQAAAFAAVIELARSTEEVEAIAVPTAQDLGRDPSVQLSMRRRLEREAGVRVLILASGS